MPSERTDNTILRRECPVLETRVINEAERTLEAYISTGDMDRHGTIIPPSAFRKTIKQFMDNPVVLVSHDSWNNDMKPPVVANARSFTIDEKGVRAVIQFAPNATALEWWQIYSTRYMRAFSIGFRVVKRTRKPREDGTGEFEVYDEIELLEISCVAVPSNKGALTVKHLEGLITRGVETLPAEQREFGERVVDWMRAADERSDAMHARLEETQRELANALDSVRDRDDELDEIRASLDALLTAGPRGRGALAPAPAPNAPQPTPAGEGFIFG